MIRKTLSGLRRSASSCSAGKTWIAAAFLAGGLAGCSGPPADAVSEALLEERLEALERRFTPGLHTLMVELAMRHATLWFAGDAQNWPLAYYQVHELEELIDDIRELHPVYREVQVETLIGNMTAPAVAEIEDAVEAQDHDAFVRGYDTLTRACNACHEVSDREALVIQRPTAPPFTNLRYRP